MEEGVVEERTCRTCETRQPIENFHWVNKARTRRRHVCKDCHHGKNQHLMPKCSVKTCTFGAFRRGLCSAHYQRLMKHGDIREDRPVVVRQGRHVQKDGYVVIPANGHPNGNKAGSILEHIKVMSDILGRPLLPYETVHHKNGVRDDNRLENLELWSGNHPKGARVVDQIAWALEIIEVYGKDPARYDYAHDDEGASR